VRECLQCGEAVEREHRYCPWCAAPQRRKLVEFFAGTGAEAGKALRVSRYRDEGHVRFSVWAENGVAEAVLSVADDEAARLAAFLTARPTPEPPRARARGEAPPAA
jgi:hypothetical protein